MDLLTDLLPTLVVLYVLDSAARVRGGQVLFVSKGWGRFEVRGPGLHLPGLWPTAEAFLVVSLPVRAAGSAVLVRAGGGVERRAELADMGPVSAAGGTVRLGPRRRFEVAPHGLAGEVAETIERLRVASERRRPAVLRRTLRRRCSVEELRSGRATTRRDLATLKVLSSAFFVALFVGLPASLLPDLPLRPPVLVVAVVALLLYAVVLLASVRLLRRSGRSGRAVASRLLPLVLFPPAAAHAAFQVGRELLLGFEPAAVAAALLDDESFRKVARRHRAERLHLASTADDEAGIVDDVAWELVLQSSGQTDETLLAAPPHVDVTADAYCPICRAEYRPGFARCSDCGVSLQAFPA